MPPALLDMSASVLVTRVTIENHSAYADLVDEARNW